MGAAAMSRLARRFANWTGRPMSSPAGAVSGRDDIAAALRAAPSGATFLPFGLGRSYGDVCLNAGGVMIESRPRDRFIAFDRDAGILRAESGVTLGEVIDIALPHGWFPPVVPGTRHVTLGGALANDVHGKNHHRSGTFGRHVARFELLRSDGPARVCQPCDPLFEATVGGMGLTGFVTWIELRLARVAGPWLVATDLRFDGLDAYFELAGRLAGDHEHVVAWIDAACTGGGFGRGVLSVADHAPADAAGRRRAAPRSTCRCDRRCRWCRRRRCAR
ncbi:MAG: FAD-binding oxidoreductase [Rhodospirillales bacterium]|nr:MAG: FAD-binding oxidoreductase [Rhodospirillales bacterium]